MKAKSIEYFIKHRSEMYNHITNEVINHDDVFKIFPAPVKSGKRVAVEILSLLLPEYKHVFVTALHRRADKNQFIELESYGISVCSINNVSKKDSCIHLISTFIKNDEKVIIHLDELDYGCGEKQLLSYILTSFKIQQNVSFILYSATIDVAKEEFIQASGLKPHTCKKFKPPRTYFGIDKYLLNERFVQATSFIENVDTADDNNKIKLSEQATKLIDNLIKSTKDTSDPRHIGVLRLAGSMKVCGRKTQIFEHFKSNQAYIEEQYNVRIRFGGTKDDDIPWDNKDWWDDLSDHRAFIFVINQTSGRSTEWRCHHKLLWYHTYRTSDTPTSTIIQDQERPVYYITTYNQPINITIYGDIECANYSAGHISLDEYIFNTRRKIDSRIKINTRKSHVLTEEPEYFDSWEDMLKKKPEYGKGRRKINYISDAFRLRRAMSLNGNMVSLTDSVWNKYSHLENYIMTNVRSSRNRFLQNKPKARPVWFLDDIKTELQEGLNAKSRIRINVYYKEGETDPDNYKLIVRRYKGEITAQHTNTAWYNHN